MAYKQHLLDVYGIQIFLAQNGREWAAIRRAHMPDLSPYDPTPGACEFHADDEKVAVAFLIQPDMTGYDHVVTCAHEATHAAELIFRYIGAKRQGEPLAYLTGWLTGWLWENTTT